MLHAGRRALLAVGLTVALCGAGEARADEADGAYGRLDGDLELRAGAGAALTGRASGLALTMAAIYLGTAGVYGHYADGLGVDSLARSLAVGVHLQPLFLGRYGRDLERGPARFDLLLDTLGLEIGAWWGWAPAGAPALGSNAGLELAVGLELPVFSSATGPFLGVRGAARLRPADEAEGGDASGLLCITLAWHQGLRGHVVDAGDRVLR